MKLKKLARTKRYLVLLITLLSITTVYRAIVETKHIVELFEESTKRIEIPKPKNWVKSDIIQMLSVKAIENNISPKYLVALANCESSLVPDVQSKYMQPYGREKSFGLFQLHLKAHTNISVEQAKDPIFNTNWAITEIKKGKAPQHWVTCHKQAIKVK